MGQFYCDSLANAESGSYCPGSNSMTNSFFPSLGNHDYSDGSGLNEYLNYFDLPGTGVVSSGTSGSDRYYDFIAGPVHLFVIDSEGAQKDASDTMTQMIWLRALSILMHLQTWGPGISFLRRSSKNNKPA